MSVCLSVCLSIWPAGSLSVGRSLGLVVLLGRMQHLSNISSTEVRRALREGDSLRYAVPAPVLEYVCKHGLYGVDQAACARKYRRLSTHDELHSSRG